MSRTERLLFAALVIAGIALAGVARCGPWWWRGAPCNVVSIWLPEVGR